MRVGFEMQPRVVLVPFPAQGHVTPMLHLAQALHAQGFLPMVASPDFIHRRIAAGRADPTDDHVGFASIPSGFGAGDAPRDFAAIDDAMENSMPGHLERLLKELDGVVCVVVDLLASWAIPVVARSGIPAAGFWPAMHATYRLISAIPELIRKGFISECGTPLYHQNHQDNQELMVRELQLPGHVKLSTKDLPWLVGNSASRKTRFAFWLRTLERAKALQWLLINSFPGEGEDVDPRSQPPERSPRTLHVGPLSANSMNSTERNEFDEEVPHVQFNPSMWEEDWSCVEWLGKQAPQSVVYVSFGSWVGPIGPEKIAEFALALESSKRPFLWVLKEDKAWRAGLPDGYLERVAGCGKVVGWAPQEEVLKHGAVGCYLTHCGWNSTVEAIQHGKRLLCYPISGDQFVNCAYIVRVWGIGIKLNGSSQSSMQDGIQKIMAGKEAMEIEARVLNLKKQISRNSRALANLQCFIDEVRKVS
ncbi:UDP-glycosyltransferase 82A1-like [Phoenix dactylifera]|uniref:Glycosyltransferase n=1 Tax=Phoenix dactylifera TaxID=42345 RepID=A0A8B8ZNU9_PHODC|nr:UDP-glycosyltransferase 82A1-like [Phoenix dactylifera]